MKECSEPGKVNLANRRIKTLKRIIKKSHPAGRDTIKPSTMIKYDLAEQAHQKCLLLEQDKQYHQQQHH